MFSQGCISAMLGKPKPCRAGGRHGRRRGPSPGGRRAGGCRGRRGSNAIARGQGRPPSSCTKPAELSKQGKDGLRGNVRAGGRGSPAPAPQPETHPWVNPKPPVPGAAPAAGQLPAEAAPGTAAPRHRGPPRAEHQGGIYGLLHLDSL